MWYSYRKECQMKKYLIAVLISMILGICNIFAQSFAGVPNGKTKEAVITVPEGKSFKTIVTTPLTSEYLTLGQKVTTVLGEDFYYNGKLIAPMESVVTGSVIKVLKASDDTNGELLLRFTRITTPYGIQIPVSAVIKNNHQTGLLSGENKNFASEKGDVDIPVNTPVDLLLIQPITVNPEVYNLNYK